MRLLLRICALCTCVSMSIAETPHPTGDAGYADAGATFFDDSMLTQIFVTVDQADLEAMLADPFNNTYRMCSVRIVNDLVDETISDVAIRPRGNTSRNAHKKSWKIKFNEFVPGREIHGLEKLNLNSHQNDPSIIRGKLSWDVYNSFGVPSPRASAVRLVINDGSLVDGVFINAEQIDDEFLTAWFGNDTGNLYQCGYKGRRADLRFIQPGDAQAYQNIGGTYELEEDSGADQFADLAAFIDFVNNADDAAFASGLVERFSVDNLLRSLAVDAVNGHWDNLWYGANNFFLYANPDTGRFEYIPFDLDNTGGIHFSTINWATRPPIGWGTGGFGWDYENPSGEDPQPPLIRRVLAIDAYRDQYLRYIRDLVGAAGVPDQPDVTAFGDTLGDVFLAGSDPHFDLVSVGVANNETHLLIDVEVAGPIDVGGATDQARIVFFFDTKPGGSTSNPWGRAIDTGRDADYFLGSWTDNGGGTLFYRWNGSGWAQVPAPLNELGGIEQDLSAKADGIARYRIPMAELGLDDTDAFAFDVVTTNDRRVGFEPGLDHLSNPGQATPDYNTTSVAGAYRVHTLSPFVPGPFETADGPFTLPPREATIDAIRDRLLPYAFQGSFANGASDFGYDPTTFADSFDFPENFSTFVSWDWGLKPYIEARTAYLRQNTPAPADLPALFINEACPNNSTIIADEAGQFEDFIEIYNAGDSTVDLSGMYLTDDPGAPMAWQFPAGTTIPAGGFLLVWADNDPLDGPLHATFGLSSGGESVALFHNDQNGVVLIDAITFPSLPADQSFGRFPDGSDSLEAFCAVTPAGPNDSDDTCFVEPGPTPRVFINEWLASNDGVALDEFGDDDDFIELYNDEAAPVDLGGRYLTDTLSDRTKWRIPDGVTIPAKGHLVFWADDEPLQGPLHAEFKLGGGGEEIGLFDRDGNGLAPIDTVVFGAQTTDVSEGRSPDASACIAVLPSVSLGSANPRGPADLDGDGVLDLSDITAFIAAFTGTAPAADLDGNGVYDLADINLFVSRFSAPCP